MTQLLHIIIVVCQRPHHAWRRLLCMRRTKSVGDFFLGGRTLGPWMSAFAYGTTYCFRGIFIGYAGKLGWDSHPYALDCARQYLNGTFLAWKLLASRTYHDNPLNALTMPEFLHADMTARDSNHLVARNLYFSGPYSASVYMGLSYLFEKTLGSSTMRR